MDYNSVIRDVSSNQHEILYNIMRLYNDGKGFECDMTYSKGAFYGTFKIPYNNSETEKIEIDIPQPKYKFDVAPQTEDTVKIEPDGNLPLDDKSIESIVIDLPFVVSPDDSASIKENKEGSNIIFKRFHGYYPWWEMPLSYDHWIKEAYRVLKDGGICVFKCQSTISGSIHYMMPYFSWLVAEKEGFYTIDDFTLVAKSRLISGKVKKQQHARKFASHFLVFQKNGKHKTVDYYKGLNVDYKPRRNKV